MFPHPILSPVDRNSRLISEQLKFDPSLLSLRNQMQLVCRNEWWGLGGAAETHPSELDSFYFAKLCFFLMVLVQSPRYLARSLDNFDQRPGKECACLPYAGVFFMP